MPEIEKHDIQVRLELIEDENERIEYANHASLNFDGSTYFLRLYQVIPPAVIDQNNPPTSLRGRHIATFAISAGNMTSIADLINKMAEQKS